MLVALGTIADSQGSCVTRSIRVHCVVNFYAHTVFDAISSFAKFAGFQGVEFLIVRERSALRINHGSDYISHATFLRFQIGRLRSLADAAAYFDADMMFLGPIESAWHETKPGELAMVQDQFNLTIGDKHVLPWAGWTHPALIGEPYFNAGAIYGLRADWEKLGALALSRARYWKTMLEYNDQDALNLAIGRPAVTLPRRFNSFEMERFLARSDWPRRAGFVSREHVEPLCVHFIGAEKPWLRKTPGTPMVRSYRLALLSTVRALRRLGFRAYDSYEISVAR